MSKGYGPKGISSIQRKMLTILSDGLPHARKELHACLWDQDGTLDNIRQHISKLRKALPKDETIVCELGFHRKVTYRHVRLLKPVPANR